MVGPHGGRRMNPNSPYSNMLMAMTQRYWLDATCFGFVLAEGQSLAIASLAPSGSTIVVDSEVVFSIGGLA